MSRRTRLETVLNELVNGRTNELVKCSELISIALLNAAGEADRLRRQAH